MDFEAFGVRDIELLRLRPGGSGVKSVLRFEPGLTPSGDRLVTMW